MHVEPDPPPALPHDGLRSFIHKLNNQLTIVMAHSELNADGADLVEMRQALQAISHAALEMAGTIRSFAKTTTLLAPPDALEGAKKPA